MDNNDHVKAGDTLYAVRAVYDGNLEMARAEVEKVTGKKIFLKERPGLAFGCAAQLPRSGRRLHTSREGAIAAYRDGCANALERARQEVADAEARLAKAEGLAAGAVEIKDEKKWW